jgi:hypothetical protein
MPPVDALDVAAFQADRETATADVERLDVGHGSPASDTIGVLNCDMYGVLLSERAVCKHRLIRLSACAADGGAIERADGRHRGLTRAAHGGHANIRRSTAAQL